MEPDPGPAERLSAHWRAVGAALANENRQWVQQVNVIDAQNNQMGVVGYTPIEAFQHQYARRIASRVNPHRTRRTRSSPLPRRSLGQPRLPTDRHVRENVQNHQPRSGWLRRVKNSGVQKLRWIGDRIVPLVNNVRRRSGRYASIGMGLGLLIALAYTNSRAAHYKAIQATPASLYISAFPNYPTWLHTDPLQVIGLPAQVDPAFIPSRRATERACRKFKSKWHPESSKNPISQQDTMAIVHRGDLACVLLENYHENHNCDRYRKSMTDFSSYAKYRVDPLLPVPNNYTSVLPSGAPHFAKDCACTYAKYRRAWWYQLLMPADLQPDPPRTLEETCPCTFDMAMKSWQSFSFSAKWPQPPYLRRIKKNLSMLTTDPRVFWWRVKGLVFHQDPATDLLQDYAVACALGTLTGCENMVAWTSPGDFNPYMARCSYSTPLPEGKMIKIEADLEDLINPSEMSEEWKQAHLEEQGPGPDDDLTDEDFEMVKEFFKEMEQTAAKKAAEEAAAAAAAKKAAAEKGAAEKGTVEETAAEEAAAEQLSHNPHLL